MTDGGFGGRIVERLDRNGDGKIGKDEIPEGMVERLKPLDANGDGFLTPEELDKMRRGDIRPGARPRPGEGRGGDSPAPKPTPKPTPKPKPIPL